MTIDMIIVKFIIKNLPTINGDPDYKYINKIIQALYANAATLYTMLSNRKHATLTAPLSACSEKLSIVRLS